MFTSLRDIYKNITTTQISFFNGFFFIFDRSSRLLIMLSPYLIIQAFAFFLIFTFLVPPYLYPSVLAKSSQQYLQIKIQFDVCEFVTRK